MKIALFGAKGTIGSRIAAEARRRGHAVTAIVRDQTPPPGLAVVRGDVLDPVSVAGVVAGHEGVVSAIGPGRRDRPEVVVQAARALVEGLRQAGVGRLVVVGGAGGLEVRPGVQLLDTPAFPPAWKAVALAHRDALEIYRKANLDWTCVSPAAVIEPGERTGRFRIGTDQLLVDGRGESRISAEDFAVAVLDEIEQARHLRRRITVAY